MIAENLARVRDRIRQAAERAGRDPQTIELVAVSKKHPASLVREAHAAGQRVFGENYAQELERKHDELSELADIEWHFIGHFQSNKAKVLARVASVVQTIAAVRHVEELGRRLRGERPRPMPVFVEVNVGGEAQKAGAKPDEVPPIVEAIEKEPTLVLRGLMTVPPDDPLATTTAFEALANLRGSLGIARVPHLSMGMSDDLEEAIERGATVVRVGTAIFGER